MSNRVAAVNLVCLLALAGCASTDPEVQIGHAMDRVEANTGSRPEWLVPWDEDSNAWDGQTILRPDDALRMALRNNRELRADLETIGQANADLVQATLLSNPVINVMLMFPAGGGRSMFRGAGLPMQMIEDLWLLPVRTEVAQRELQQTVLRVADRAVETAEAVSRVYSRLQYAQRALELIHENLQVVRQTTEIIGIRQEAGQATQVAVTLSRIRELRLRSELITTEAEYGNLQRELLLFMGRPLAQTSWGVEGVSETAYAVAAPPPEDDLLMLAEEHRLDLRAAEWKVRVAEERIRLRRREGWPKIALGLSLERMAAPRSNNPSWVGRAGNAAYAGAASAVTGSMGGGMSSGPFAPKMRGVDFAVGPMLELEIPIFDWGQARTARAVHEWQQRVADYEALAQRIIRDVRQSRVTGQQAYEQVVFYRDAILPEVERNLELARQLFIAGREDLTVYLDVQEDLVSTRLRALAFLRDYLITQAELQRQVGGRLKAVEPQAEPRP